MIFSTFFGESSQTHEGSSTEFPEFLPESVRFDFRIEICAGLQFIKNCGAFVQPQKTDPTVLVAAALGYIVKRTLSSRTPGLEDRATYKKSKEKKRFKLIFSLFFRDYAKD
jgi:hypothetical protein